MKLGQVSLYVSDMARSVEFYRDKLGLTVTYSDGEDFAGQFWVTLGDEGCSLALHSGGAGQTADLTPAISFMSDDVEGARSSLIAKGVKLSEIEEPHPGVKFCSGQDPDGHRFFIHIAH